SAIGRSPIAIPSASAKDQQAPFRNGVPVGHCIQKSPIKAKKPTSIRKVTDMIATVTNASLTDMGAMGMPPLVGPRFNKFTWVKKVRFHRIGAMRCGLWWRRQGIGTCDEAVPSRNGGSHGGTPCGPRRLSVHRAGTKTLPRDLR